MIQLPDNFMDMTMVLVSPGGVGDDQILLHIKNAHDQYFSYMSPINKAVSLQKSLDAFESKRIDGTLSGNRAYTLTPDMATEYSEPLDQDWKPTPPGPFAGNVVSMQQYKAMKETNA